MFEEIVLSYINDKEKMIEYAKQNSGLDEEAEDIMQDAYLRLIKNKDGMIDSNQINSRLHYYMKCSINNRFKLYNHDKIKKRHLNKKYISQKFDESQDPLIKMIDRHEEVFDLVHKIPIFYRTIIELTQEGYEYKEISEGLDMIPSTLRSRIKRGKKLLQKEYYKRKEMF